MTRRVVLVTGATGLIGWPTMPQFAPLGFSVVGLARHGAAGCLSGDIFDPGRMHQVLAEVRPTHVLHLAWDVTPGRFPQGPENLDYVSATLGFARAAAAAGVQRFVGVGTCGEYDWRDGGAVPRREDDAVLPDTLYGVAKDAAHRLLAAFFARAGIGFAWARPFYLFGPGELPKRLVGGAIAALRRGERFICRHGGLERDFMATEDVGAALARLVAGAVSGPVNIASGESITLGALVAFVGERLGRPELMEVHDEPAPDQPAAMRADVTRLREEVGFVVGASVRARLAGQIG